MLTTAELYDYGIHTVGGQDRKANLIKLSAYLRGVVEDFDMRYFNQYERDACKHACGTSACAVGHGPSAGLKPLLGERWISYSKRVFIEFNDDTKLAELAWEWCFSDEWSGVDNTALGASRRIDYLLEHGLDDVISVTDRGWDYVIGEYVDSLLDGKTDSLPFTV